MESIMTSQAWIPEHLNKLNNDVSAMISDDPALIADPDNLDELVDKLTQMIFERHELPMNHYKVDIEELATGGCRIKIGLDYVATAVVVK